MKLVGHLGYLRPGAARRELALRDRGLGGPPGPAEPIACCSRPLGIVKKYHITTSRHRGLAVEAPNRQADDRHSSPRPPSCRHGTEGFFVMSWDDADSYLEKQIGELKSLTIGVSRGLRDLTRAEPRGRAEPERRPSHSARYRGRIPTTARRCSSPPVWRWSNVGQHGPAGFIDRIIDPRRFVDH